MQSIFGFYYIMGLLSHIGWPRRRSLFNSEAVVNSLILDSAVEQMIDWAASIGACRPKLALQMITTMFRDTDWESKDAMNLGAEVSNMKKQWAERGNSDNPREVVKPVKFSKHSEVMTMKQLKDKKISHAFEVYCYESLIWGLTNSDNFKTYFSADRERQREKMPEYKKADLAVDYIPTLDQTLEGGEEILKGYGKEIRELLPIPQKLQNDALSLGIGVND
jgi:hypothetical protein